MRYLVTLFLACGPTATTEPPCYPGASRCMDDAVEVCTQYGTWSVEIMCHDVGEPFHCVFDDIAWCSP